MKLDYHSSAKERRAMILALLDKENEVSVTKLSKALGTSEVTIRKDLTNLQNRNLLVRTRGGAIRRPVENLNEDTAISLDTPYIPFFLILEGPLVGGHHQVLHFQSSVVAMLLHLWP